MHLDRYYQHFSRDQIHLINGYDLIHDPGRVLEELADFMEVERHITRDNFIYDEEQGFYCIKTKESEEKFCIGDHSNHGSSRNQKKRKKKHEQEWYDFDEGVKEQLEHFYQPFNQDLEEKIGRSGFTDNLNRR